MANKVILLMYGNHNPSKKHVAMLKKLALGYRIIVAMSHETAVEAAPNATIILGHRYLKQTLPYAKNLEWVQSSSGGFDHLPTAELLERNILLTRTTFPSKVIARHAYSLSWALNRRLPEFFTLQNKRRWDSSVPMLPLPKTALVLGLGAIGFEIAKLLKSDGMQVWGVKRTPTSKAIGICDRLFTDNSWKHHLSNVDICFIALPISPATKHIVNTEVIKLLPSHAVIINIGRGATLDTVALVNALKKGELGGAGLDVVESYPLKRNSFIWITPNLILTPYVAGRYPERAEQLELYFESQLKNYLNNHPLKNIVDLKNE